MKCYGLVENWRALFKTDVSKHIIHHKTFA